MRALVDSIACIVDVGSYIQQKYSHGLSREIIIFFKSGLTVDCFWYLGETMIHGDLGGYAGSMTHVRTKPLSCIVFTKTRVASCARGIWHVATAMPAQRRRSRHKHASRIPCNPPNPREALAFTRDRERPGAQVADACTTPPFPPQTCLPYTMQPPESPYIIFSTVYQKPNRLRCEKKICERMFRSWVARAAW